MLEATLLESLRRSSITPEDIQISRGAPWLEFRVQRPAFKLLSYEAAVETNIWHYLFMAYVILIALIPEWLKRPIREKLGKRRRRTDLELLIWWTVRRSQWINMYGTTLLIVEHRFCRVRFWAEVYILRGVSLQPGFDFESDQIFDRTLLDEILRHFCELTRLLTAQSPPRR